MPIQMTPCASTNVRAHGYDPETKTLALRFLTGEYHYSGVPESVYDGLKAADSVGRFVSTAIRPMFEGVLQKPAIGATDI